MIDTDFTSMTENVSLTFYKLVSLGTRLSGRLRFLNAHIHILRSPIENSRRQWTFRM